MKNITALFNKIYVAKKALVVYELEEGEKDVYVEAYDMDSNCRPVNAHPLSVEEADILAECLQSAQKNKSAFLAPRSLLSKQVLYIQPGNHGYAIWLTPAQKRNLLFKEQLGIPCGEACTPALIWKASQNELEIFAILSEKDPTTGTLLCHAPFFNIFPQGNVCMGTVDIDIPDDCCLEDFIQHWEDYFFNSYFSHMVAEHLPVKGNMVQLWKLLVNTGETFPAEVLLKNGKKLKHLID